MNPNGYNNMLNRPVLRAPAVHGVSSNNFKNDLTKKLHVFASKSCPKTSPEIILSNSNIFGPGPSWPKS